MDSCTLLEEGGTWGGEEVAGNGSQLLYPAPWRVRLDPPAPGTPGCPRLFGSFGFASRDPPHFPLWHLPCLAHPTLHFTHTLAGFSQCFSSLMD